MATDIAIYAKNQQIETHDFGKGGRAEWRPARILWPARAKPRLESINREPKKVLELSGKGGWAE